MSDKVTRRDLIAGAAIAAGGLLLPSLDVGAVTPPQVPTPTPAPPDTTTAVPDDPTTVLGAPTSQVGTRSPFVQPVRTPYGEQVGSSYTPHQLLMGTVTPADLHFERHHAGVPRIDPKRHRLLIHGLVDRPMIFSVDEIRRLPSVTRTHFIECSGNGRKAYQAPTPDMTSQLSDGMTSNSEWTGVPLATLLAETGVRTDAKWLLAEGSDACRLARSIPMDKALDDALVVWGQNGEPIRPEQGFPLRLLLPGWEGNTNVKWLRRIVLAREPFMTRWETSKYTDPLPNDTARIFSFAMDAKSIITKPSHPDVLAGPGWWPIIGLAWSGRGRIARVDVSTDGGRTWTAARLQDPVLPRAHTRFEHMWKWDGKPTLILSRAADETGYVQPTMAAFRQVRGRGTDFHFNSIRGWRVAANGALTFEAET